MINTNKKNAKGLWIDRLFNQSGSSLSTPSRKSCFARQSHCEQDERQRSAFSALFSDAGKEQHPPESEPVNFQKLFEHEAPLSKETSDRFIAAPTGAAYIQPAANTKSSGSIVTVKNCYAETPDTKTFRLGSPNDEVFDYLPGQYITLTVIIGGQEYKRSYSLASSPGRSKILDITVKRAAQPGMVSNWLNDHLKIGDTLNIKGPFGKFSFVNQTANKILFLAAGSGIVPIMSMLRWVADTETGLDVRVLLSFRTPEDIIFRDELEMIAARHKNIHLAITVTTDAYTADWSGLTGRVNEKMIADQAPDLPERTVYLCGPNAFMGMCKENLLKLNCPLEKIYCESFTVNNSVTKPEGSSFIRPSTSNKGVFRIGFTQSEKSIVTDGCISLLELAERSGIIVGHDCRSGQCGECMMKCLKGKIKMTAQAEIDVRDRKKGWIYACCAYPVSDILLDI
jgi:ferredoxin-NADP reductase